MFGLRASRLARVRRGVELGRSYTIFLRWDRRDSAARVLRYAYPDPIVFEAFVRTIASEGGE